MKIDAATKVIGRFHTQASPRGLNIYNPLFQEMGINAVYVLFHDPNPAVLMQGLRSLKLAGAITAGFESDTVLPTLVDELDDVSKFVGKIGYLTNQDGVVTGRAQGGQGVLRTIKHLINPQGKKLTIVGAGNLAKQLLFEMKKEGIECEIEICNRTLESAQQLKEQFAIVKKVVALTRIEDVQGDVLINLTDIGGSVTDLSFPGSVIDRFSNVVEITFETEQTPLVIKAQELGKNIATGWDMFAYQAQVILEGILDTKIEYKILKKHVVAGLSTSVR